MVKTAHASAFVVLGFCMEILPGALAARFSPEWFGMSATSLMWINLMGWVNIAIGAAYLFNLQLVPLAARMLAWKPEVTVAKVRRQATQVPNNILRPALNLNKAVSSRRPVPVAVRVKERAVA